ncbi:uncharacterized protein LOC114661616 isoform X2 [Erpetoichthys calabaricus]|uniref:uncharacterized protein LOC114661616 isoform X2 n=1 Tax=Erpetoichthys calabaricus TaxID=27687 RepID=UPI00223448C6|nr:uncharacterized protein LOC114661616 isoform X2 [Erpetoichthys calabaricus]
MTCSAKNFYPKEIRFIWTRSGKAVSPLNTAEPSMNPDGTYNSESVYSFTPTSRDDLICEVEHNALKEMPRRYVRYVGLTGAEVTLMVFAVFAFLLVLLAVFWFFSVSLSPLVPLKLVQGDLGSVKCILTGWRLGLVTQQWLINDQEVKLDNQQRDCEDVTSVPHNDPSGYHLKTDPPKKGFFRTETPVTLQFLPTRADHEGAVCRYRVRHRLTQRSVERTVTLQRISIRPQLSDIENVSEDSDNTDVKLQIRADEFHPKNIRFTWTLGGENVKTDVPDIPDHSKETFSTVSVCSVPLSKVQKPGFKASVVIEHESVGQLEKTVTSDTPGIDGRPLLSDIQVVRFTKLGEPCNLSCTVSRFFPSAVTVTWLRAKAEGGHQPVTAGSPHWTATVNRPTPEKRNNIYEVTSEVQFTPKQLSEFEEMTYICRVGHMTLMGQPIEKTAGNLELEGCQKMPRAMDLKIHFVELNQPCILSCTITDFYPKEIKVTWLRRDKEKKQWEAGTPQWKATTAHYGPSMRKNTFDLVTQVKFTPMQLSELEDMEFFCTVQHLSITGKYMERSSAGVYIPGWLLAQQAKKFGTTAGYVDNNEKGFTSNLYFGDGKYDCLLFLINNGQVGFGVSIQINSKVTSAGGWWGAHLHEL